MFAYAYFLSVLVLSGRAILGLGQSPRTLVSPGKCLHPTEMFFIMLNPFLLLGGSNSQLRLSLVQLAQDERNTGVGPLVPHRTPNFTHSMLRSVVFSGQFPKSAMF